MKLINGLFLVAFGVCVLPVCKVNAASKHCTSGEFYMSSACRDCPKGCYCPYNSGDRLQLDPCNLISNSKVEDWCGRKKNRCDYAGGWMCSFNDEYKACGRNEKAGVYRCPDEFPFSKSKAISIADCYITINGKNIYHKSTTCEAGKYLPVSSNDCASCPDGFVCPGGKFDVSLTVDQGKNTCSSGMPNLEKTACEDNVNFEKGSQSVDNNGIEVEVGYFLPENSVNPKSCVGVANENQYCPGGTFEKSSLRQGLEKCPANGTVNKSRTSCTITLTKEQMEHGFNGTGSANASKKCWFQTDLISFKDCVLGTNSRQESTNKKTYTKVDASKITIDSAKFNNAMATFQRAN